MTQTSDCACDSAEKKTRVEASVITLFDWEGTIGKYQMDPSGNCLQLKR